MHKNTINPKIGFMQASPSPLAGLPASKLQTNQKLNKEKQMQNEVTITGTIKNIKTYKNERGTLLTGWLDQRDYSRMSDGTADRAVYVVGMNIIALDSSTIGEILGTAKAGTEITLPVTVSGRLVTKFDRRQNIDESKRRAPFPQLEVHSVEVNA